MYEPRSDDVLDLKLTGSKGVILEFLSSLEKQYRVGEVSRFIPNEKTGGVHVYVKIQGVRE